MKIYTKTGDDGQTGLFGGPRVTKNDHRIEAFGEVDELNAALGVLRACSLPPEVDRVLQRVQNELFAVGAELATPDRQRMTVAPVGEHQVASLEADIDRWQQELPALKNFILPGGTLEAAWLHLARAVCRRAERRVVTLALGETIGNPSHVVAYLNRLSDLLFVAARKVNQARGIAETTWRGERPFSQEDSNT